MVTKEQVYEALQDGRINVERLREVFTCPMPPTRSVSATSFRP